MLLPVCAPGISKDGGYVDPGQPCHPVPHGIFYLSFIGASVDLVASVPDDVNLVFRVDHDRWNPLVRSRSTPLSGAGHQWWRVDDSNRASSEVGPCLAVVFG